MAETEIKSINGYTLCDNQARSDIEELNNELENMVVEETDPTVPAWAKQPNKPTYTANEVGALPNTTKIPTKTSDLTNDSGFLTQHQSLSGYAKTADHYTKTESDNKYQPKGSYLTSVPSEYVTETELAAKKYLTAVPSEYVTDSELSAKGYAKQTDVNSLSEEIADLKTPSYVISEAKETAGKVLSHQSENSFTIAWLSDLHIGNKYQVDGLWTTDETSNIEASQGLHEMSKTSPCDVIAIGGDLASGTITNTHEEGLDQLDGCIEILRPATFYTPTLYLVGNHDDAPWRATADRLTRAELFSRLGRKNLLCGAVTNNSDMGCLYGYKDFESQKMRVIYLDTHDKNGWESINCVSGTNSNSDYMDACNISAKQLDWFANTALDFSDKSNPSEWGVVVLSHTQLTIHSGTGTYTANGKSYKYNTDNAITIMTAYLNKGSGSITLNGETANYDFSELTEKAYLYCHIHGHEHAYKFAELGGKKIPSIGCPNTRAGGERVSDDGNTYTKTAGTCESCSFNVITIDRQNGKIYADNHGAGVDREFDVVVYSSYTNLLPSATKPVAGEGSAMDTALFNNGLGYANNTRISGIGHSAGTGYVATGYIPYKIKEDGTFGTIYIKGATLDTSLSYVRFVNLQYTSATGVKANKATVGGSTSANTMLATYFTIEELGTDYYKLTPTSGAGFSGNTFAVMFSLKGTGDNLIITVDEPIV